MTEQVLQSSISTGRAGTQTNTTESAPSFWRFAAAGAFGGFGAFLLGRLTGAGPFANKPAILDFPAEIVLGTMAALFAVYLLAASDVTATRTVVFAILCGLFWNPVIAGAKAYVQQYADNQVAGSAAEASNLAKQIRVESGPQAENAIVKASSQITGALNKLPDVTTSSSRQAIVNNSTQVVNSVPAATATPTSVQAIKNIGLMSVKSGAPQVSVASYNRLREIAARSTSAETRIAAEKAAAALASQSPAIAAVKQ